MYGRLGDRINGSVVSTEGAGDGANGNDAALFARHHVRRQLAAAENAGQQIAIHNSANIRQGNADAVVRARPAAAAHARPGGANVTAGIGHQNIDGTPLRPDRIGHALHFRLVGNVAPDRHRQAAGLGGDIPCYLLHGLALAERLRRIETCSVDGHRRAERAKLGAHDAAQAAR